MIVAVSCRDTFWLIGRSLTVLPTSAESGWHQAENLASLPLGGPLPAANPFRQFIVGYLHAAGIETGYGYFAPNVPGQYKLLFEVHFSDEHVEYDFPGANSAAGGLRVAGLLDQLGRTEYEPLRKLMLRMLVHAAWRRHPDAIMIRAIFGRATIPKIAEFKMGARQTYEFLYAYDFTLKDEKTRKEQE